MAELHFQKHLDKEFLKKLCTEYGFRNPVPLEQFIVDFGVLYHILEILPDCVVKGGMAVPFHLRDNLPRCLSVDIDIVTGHSKTDVTNAMNRLSEKLDGIIHVGSPHRPHPKSALEELPLLTYYCKYASSVNETSEIKIEIFYENKMAIKSQKINPPVDLFGFSIDFPLSIYDRGSLIGDKLTTLPFHTIGIHPGREVDVPKQIHGIASLLKSFRGKFPTNEVLNSFENISNDEIGYFTKNPPSFDDVLKDLDSFSDRLLSEHDTIKLERSYHGRFGHFAAEMLGNTRYFPHAHVTDILLVRVLAKLILKKFDGKLNSDLSGQKISAILSKLNKLPGFDSKGKTELIRQIKHRYRHDSVGNLIKNLQAEQAYLYDNLLEFDRL